jgi:biotin operon repressor
MDLSEGKGISVPAAPDIQQLPHIDKRKFIVIPYRAATDPRIWPSTMRALQIVCSYCNKAGITWASQKRMAQDLGITPQAFNANVVRLKKLGYLKTEHKGWRGERADTMRVIFEPGQTLDDILATNNDPTLAPPELQPRQPYSEEDLVPAPKKVQGRKSIKKTYQQTENDKGNLIEQSPRLTLEEGTRVFGNVVNEAELGLITLALELGATRGMLEVCACAGDRVGALKVLVGRLDRACR